MLQSKRSNGSGQHYIDKDVHQRNAKLNGTQGFELDNFGKVFITEAAKPHGTPMAHEVLLLAPGAPYFSETGWHTKII